MTDQSSQEYDLPENNEEARDDEGVIIVGVLTSNNLFENKDATLAALMGEPQGAIIWLGEIGGRISGAEKRPPSDPKFRESVWLEGIFEAQRVNLQTGEVTTLRSPWLILPGGYGPIIFNALKADPSAVIKLDVELGVTRSPPGQAIPHRYIVKERVPVDPRSGGALAEIRADREARALRKAQRRPKALPGV